MNPLATELIFQAPVPANKWSCFIHGTTPYMHSRCDSKIGPQDFRIGKVDDHVMDARHQYLLEQFFAYKNKN